MPERLGPAAGRARRGTGLLAGCLAADTVAGPGPAGPAGPRQRPAPPPGGARPLGPPGGPPPRPPPPGAPPPPPPAGLGAWGWPPCVPAPPAARASSAAA